MTPDQIFAFVGALLATAPDPAFDRLRAGGADPRYPVAVAACPAPLPPLEVEGRTMVCGTVSVPEDHAKPEGRRIGVRFTVLRARSVAPAPDPVAYLHGGPGAGTMDQLPLVARGFEKLRATRDIVTFDQRAAGLTSTTVRCMENIASNIADVMRLAKKELSDLELGARLFAPCVAEVRASGADLPQYNTRNNARDVRAILSALGYPEYNIYGISYGTRLALEVLRTAPEGVRAAVVDSVAPTSVHLYDNLLGPHAAAVDAIVTQCAADPGCNAAYPDLGARMIALAAKLKQSPIPAGRGQPAIDADAFLQVLEARNGHDGPRDVTAYVPRMVAELSEGRTDTFDFLATRPGRPDVAAMLQRAAGRLAAQDRALLSAALAAAEAMRTAGEAATIALAQLRADLSAPLAAASVAEAFDIRATAALTAMPATDRTAFASAYALLPGRERTRETLASFVAEQFGEPARGDLAALVAAMTGADVARTFEIAERDTSKFVLAFAGTFNLAIYACQEDMPWNSPEGAKATNDRIAYPFLVNEDALQTIAGLFEICRAFTPVDHPGFHEPVRSDLPVLVLSGLNDTQTSWEWGPLAAQTLTNARSFVFPEAGHGVLIFSACATDIGVAFIADPEAVPDTSCIAGLKPRFVLPDAPLAR